MKQSSSKRITTPQRTPQRVKKVVAEPESPDLSTKIDSLMTAEVDPAKVLVWVKNQEDSFFDDNSYELLIKCLELFNGKDMKLTNYSILLKKAEDIVSEDDLVTHDLLAIYTMKKLMRLAKPRELLLFLSELSENLTHTKTVFCLEFVLSLMVERPEESERGIQIAFDLIYFLITRLISKFSKLDSKVKAVLFDAELSKSLIINKGEWEELKDYIMYVLSKKLYDMLIGFSCRGKGISALTNKDAGLFDYDEYIECTPKNPNNIKLKSEPPKVHFISVLLTKLIAFLRKEDSLYRGESNSFNSFIPYCVEKFKLLNSNSMVTINNFKILLKLKKDFSKFYEKNCRVFYDLEGIILVILDSLTKMKQEERDILSQGFMERLLNVLGGYLLEDLMLTNHDLLTTFVNIYTDITDTEELTQSDNVKFCPHLLIFCGLSTDREIGTKSSVLAQKIIQTMNIKKKFQVYRELINIDTITAFQMVSIPKAKWFTMFFSIITENMKKEIDEKEKQQLTMKNVEDLVNNVSPLFLRSFDDGNLELASTYLGFFRTLVNIVLTNRDLLQINQTKNMMRGFRTLGIKSEEK